jgi:hypothetical protein
MANPVVNRVEGGGKKIGFKNPPRALISQTAKRTNGNQIRNQMRGGILI